MTRRRTTGAALAAVLLLAGCASLEPGGGAPPEGTGDEGPGTDGTEEDGVDDGDLVVRVHRGGGFVPMGWAFSSVADLTVYDDGLAVTQGPTTLEHPGRLLPNLQTSRLTPEDLDAVADAARDAGLLADAPSYGQPMITDVGSTLVTVRVDGVTYEHDAYALDMVLDPGSPGAEGLTDAELEARAALAGFVDQVRSLVDGVEATGPYRPGAFAVMARPVDDGEQGLEPAPSVHEWPLDVPLAGADCVVVDGADAETLLPVLEAARQNDRMTHDGATYEVWARVMLPGDPGCGGSERAPAQG